MFLSFHTQPVFLLPEEDQPENKSVITRLKEIPPEQGGYDPSCSRNKACTSPPALVQVTQSYGIAINHHENWTEKDLEKALLANKPVFVSNRVELDANRVSHYFVVVGLVGDKVYYNDPLASSEAEGKKKEGTLEELMKAWYTNIDAGKDPTKPEGWNGWGMAAQ